MAAGLIIAFHTTDALYTREARRLRASVERFGLPIELTPIESAGSWVENCSRKAAFLLDRRQALRGPLLYLDVDAVVHADPWPHLADFDADIAVYYPTGGKLVSATILLGDTEGCMRLLKDWRDRSEADRTVWDQVVLQQLIDEGKFVATRLPATFCYIFGGDSPSTEEPVIEQLQASREWRVGRRSIWRLWRQSGRSVKLLQARRDRAAAIEADLGIA